MEAGDDNVTEVSVGESRTVMRLGEEKRMSLTAEQEMACQQLVELITDYLEGALPRPVVQQFEAHLAVCTGCTNYLDQMRTTIRQLQGIGSAPEAPPLTPTAKQELLNLFRNWVKEGA